MSMPASYIRGFISGLQSAREYITEAGLWRAQNITLADIHKLDERIQGLKNSYEDRLYPEDYDKRPKG